MVSVHNGELRWTLYVLLFQGCSPYDVPITASLPDSNFNASSVLSASFNEPYMAKLWGNSEWCPATASLGAEYFQVDFSRPFRVCAVDTQGHHTLSTWFVSSFNITYSLNESTWFTAQQNETNGVSTLLMRPGDLGLNWLAHWRCGFETWTRHFVVIVGNIPYFTVRLSTQECKLPTASSQRELMNYMEEW